MSQSPKSNVADFHRSPELLDQSRSQLLIVDVQEKLLPVIQNADAVTAGCLYLMQVAKIMGVPIVVSEQYPKGLGSTISVLREPITDDHVFEKLRFSAAEGFQTRCHKRDKAVTATAPAQVVIAGIETHICVLQTALDLLAAGYCVFVVEDATGSRSETDRDAAFQRIRDAGAVLVTAESVAFEWCEVAATDEFKQISRLTRHRDTARKN